MKVKPRVLLISNMYPGEKAPTYGIFVKVIADSLTEQGCKIVRKVVISKKGGSLPVKAFRYLGFYCRAILSLASGGYDIVYGHFLSHVAFPLFLAKRFSTKKVVINVHGTDVVKSSNMKRILGWMIRRVVHDADLIVAPSETFKRTVCGTYNVNADKVFVSPSGGVDLNIFLPNDYAENSVSGTLRLGYVSRIDSEKGWDVLLNSLSILRKRGINKLNCQIIGDGLQRDTLLEKTQTLGLSEVVTCLGAKPHHLLPDYYRQFDIFIYPTIRESLGLVGLEAMACGVPVIASRIPALEEYVADNVNGYLFRVGDADVLADKIVAFMKLRFSCQQEMCKQAVETVRRYNRVTVASDLMTRFDQLLSEQ